MPPLCTFSDANYTLSIMLDGREVKKLDEYFGPTIEYEQPRKNKVELELKGLELNTEYTAVITVSNEISSTSTEFNFSEYIAS